MAVAVAGVSGDALAEVECHDLLARARVAVRGAELAVRRAQETVAHYRAGRERAQRLMAEAKALRAKDCAATTREAAHRRTARSRTRRSDPSSAVDGHVSKPTGAFGEAARRLVQDQITPKHPAPLLVVDELMKAGGNREAGGKRR
jgi:hypothetical protein